MEIRTQIIKIEVETLEAAAARELQLAYSLYASYNADIVAGKNVEIAKKCAAEHFQEIMKLRSFLGL